MKTPALRFFAAVFAAGVLSASIGCASQAQAPQVTQVGPPLQVEVIVPPSWRPMFEENVADALASHVSDVFRREGFRGAITEVPYHQEPTGAADLLTLRLIEWRMDHTGSIQCTFGASLQTPQGARDLGVFNGTAFRWMSGIGRFGLADSFGDAADDAIRDMYRAMAKTQLIPGAAPTR